jgi:serine/threonine protein kinase
VGGRYIIKGVLGEGGMGTVFDAEHLGLSRQVAIKVLSPSQAKKKVAVKRFQQEARAAGAIGHPNICEVYDLGLLEDGSPYLVMEKLVGQTLSDRIAKEGGLPFDDVIEIVGQVLSGLIAAHEKGIVHRDIKPENIFLARRVGCPPIIKLLDFGVSKMMAEFQTSEDALDLTRTGMVMGTPYYMSPEQARGERNLDGRVDVYACGVVMYETITGKRPFLAPNYNALLLAIINTSPKNIRDVRPATPPELEAIIQRAMQRNRADRYAGAKEMLRDLVPPLPDGSLSRMPPPPSPEERRRAPALGGGRNPEPRPNVPDGDTRVETGSRPGVGGGQASAPLRSRMSPSRDASIHTAPINTTRRSPGQSPRHPSAHSESIDIPIHITDMRSLEDIPVDENDATAVFQPSKHGRSAPPPRESALPPPPQPRRSSIPPPPRGVLPKPYGSSVPPQKPSAVPPPQNARPLGAPKAPLLPRIQTDGDEWDGETVVKSPEMPFNAEQTMKIEGSELDRLENRRPPPRRR